MDTEKTLNVGDLVTQTYGGVAMAVKRITRVTEKYAFIQVSEHGEIKLMRHAYSDGAVREISSDKWSRTSYRITKQGDAEIIRRANVRQSVKNTDWRNVSDEKIQQIYEILNT